MKYLIFPLLLVLSNLVIAGGGSEEVKLISLEEIETDKYVLKYRAISSQKVITVRLEYDPIQYLFLKTLNKDKYQNSILLLKKQVLSQSTVRFGSFGGGPCLIDKKNSVYRSDALDIYDEDRSKRERLVIYAFCEYK